MVLLIGFLTFILLLDCLLLILLVLIQLPKKEAGAGLAFGGAATDALFGAGTGNVLTKMTKWGTGAFFVLLLVIGLLQANHYKSSSRKFAEGADAAAQKTSLPTAAPAPSAPTVPAATPPPSTNYQLLTPTNLTPVAPATSAPAAPK
jgi:preprotein translocase subunit SecG